ncbi:S-ribosylhomocysteine lyase, partial [Peptacetobacter sp.]|uniref:S-ribosylhomocysteine lyase n=1 Tax=Peptacetobacter sp. TaxID=2991975 RepID=UPI002630F8B3
CGPGENLEIKSKDYLSVSGYYLIMWGDVEPAYVKEGLEKALEMVLTTDEIPAATAVECGNYRDLSLFGAKEYAKKALDEGFSLNIYGE